METKKISRHSVTAMFDRISPTYDRLNRILSFGVDKLWRRKVRKFLPKGDKLTLIDLATGTADQILALRKAKNVEKFLGFDLSEKMLAKGLEKIERANLSKKAQLQIVAQSAEAQGSGMFKALPI